MENVGKFDRESHGTEAWVDWLMEHQDATLSMQPEVLILAARYGDGHLRAAKAIASALQSANPALRLGLLDYYRFVNPRLDSMIRWGYITSVRLTPSLWRWFYTSTQRIDPESMAQRFFNHIGLSRFLSAFEVRPPKVVVSTYPTAAGVVSTLKQSGRLDVVNLVVMTDYSVHSQWIHAAVDCYFVGSEDMREALIARGIDEKCIVVSGIPVDRRFAFNVDEAEAQRRMGVEGPVVLFMGGPHMPANEFTDVLKAIDRVNSPHTTVVITGRGTERKELAEAYLAHARHPMKVLGYVDNVHEWMAVASMLVSKAGGLTTTESLCRGLPIVIYRPIPGQEDANADFLVRHGAGRLAKEEAEVGRIVNDLLEHPWDLKTMARAAKSLGHPEAAQTIAEYVHQALYHQRAHAQG